MRMKVSLAEPDIGEDEAQAVYEVVRSGWISEGKLVREFEDQFASYVGSKHAIATFNGTVGLHLMLLAYGIGSGDEVIVPSLTFISTVTSVMYADAKPVFAEINPLTFNLDPNDIERHITNRTKAIIPVHYGGQPADMIPILEIAEKYQLYVFEDAAEAHGAEYASKKVGTFGHAAMFSFTPTKNITTGEGGIITTNDSKIAKNIRLLKNHGQESLYRHIVLGYNYRMTEMQAALGLKQLEKLDGIIAKKRKNAKFLSAEISQINGLSPPFMGKNRKHTYMLYTISIEPEQIKLSRDEILQALQTKGIEARVYFPPVHLQPLFKKLGYEEGMLPTTEKLYKNILSLPFHSKLNHEQLFYMLTSLREILNTK